MKVIYIVTYVLAVLYYVFSMVILGAGALVGFVYHESVGTFFIGIKQGRLLSKRTTMKVAKRLNVR